MKLLVDAQLPKRLAEYFCSVGLDAIHTLDLPLKNESPDSMICRFAEEQSRIVVTKDYDFLQSQIVKDQPRQLILVKTGNIGNRDLVKIFTDNLDTILQISEKGFRIIELHQDRIIYS